MSVTSLAVTSATHPTSPPLRLARGIWLPGDVDPDDAWARWRRIAEALPPHSVLVGWFAALLHQLWLPYDTRHHPLEFASTAPGRGRDMNRSRRPELRGSRRQFAAGDVVEIDRIAVTSPARTWLDFAGRIRLIDLVALGDSVLRTGTSIAELDDLVARSVRRRGNASARLALPLLDARSRSHGESHLRMQLLVPGWPRFEVNTAIRDLNGGWLAEPDLSNEEYAVAVEYQGMHHAAEHQMSKDLTRQITVVGNRWQSLSVGARDVYVHPALTRTAVHTMFRSQGWEGPPRTTRPRPRVASSTTNGQQ